MVQKRQKTHDWTLIGSGANGLGIQECIYRWSLHVDSKLSKLIDFHTWLPRRMLSRPQVDGKDRFYDKLIFHIFSSFILRLPEHFQYGGESFGVSKKTVEWDPIKLLNMEYKYLNNLMSIWCCYKENRFTICWVFMFIGLVP